MAKKYVNPTKVVTGECRFSYANLWEAKAMDENSKPKYSVSLIIPKSDTKRSRQRLKPLMKRAKASSATENLSLLSVLLRHHFVTEIPTDRTMKPMQTAISSMQTRSPLPVLLMQTVSRS